MSQHAPIGELIDELLLIWAASEAEERKDRNVVSAVVTRRRQGRTRPFRPQRGVTDAFNRDGDPAYRAAGTASGVLHSPAPSEGLHS